MVRQHYYRSTKQRARAATKKAAELAETNGNTPAATVAEENSGITKTQTNVNQSTGSNDSSSSTQENKPPQQKKKRPSARTRTRKPKTPTITDGNEDAPTASNENGHSPPTATAAKDVTEQPTTESNSNNDKPLTEAQIARKKRQAEKRKANQKKKRAAKRAAAAEASKKTKITEESSNDVRENEKGELEASEESASVHVPAKVVAVAEDAVEVEEVTATAKVEVVEATEEEVVITEPEPTPTVAVTIPEQEESSMPPQSDPQVVTPTTPAFVSPERTFSKGAAAMIDLLANDCAKDSKEMSENVKFVDMVPSDTTGVALKAILTGSPGKNINVSEKDSVAECMRDMLKNDSAQRTPKKQQPVAAAGVTAEPSVVVQQQVQPQKAVVEAKAVKSVEAQPPVTTISVSKPTTPPVSSSQPKPLNKVVVKEPLKLPEEFAATTSGGGSSKNAFVPVGELPPDDGSSNDCACVIS